ncbi:uncharacterized protein LTR77_009923 [Saxophila tyrrhenica]|uniref:Uncharacterized protein n=1 Tax=Saxophila tyrrhenica TaxID=1690608 RepID=A0AAV9NWG8_9PEZI|nr:hypothetical protein LTR77_009923 [Saxophila tyrrhenica]
MSCLFNLLRRRNISSSLNADEQPLLPTTAPISAPENNHQPPRPGSLFDAIAHADTAFGHSPCESLKEMKLHSKHNSPALSRRASDSMIHSSTTGSSVTVTAAPEPKTFGNRRCSECGHRCSILGRIVSRLNHCPASDGDCCDGECCDGDCCEGLAKCLARTTSGQDGTVSLTSQAALLEKIVTMEAKECHNLRHEAIWECSAKGRQYFRKVLDNISRRSRRSLEGTEDRDGSEEYGICWNW